MKKNNLNYYIGDSYSLDIRGHFENILAPFFNVQEFKKDTHKGEIVFVSPTVNQIEIDELKNLKVVLILDYCHFDFLDLESYAQAINPLFIISPKSLAFYQGRVIDFSLSMDKMENRVVPKIENSKILYCSQPLAEDKRFEDIDQNTFLQELLKVDPSITVKRHPRENAYPKISCIEFKGTIDEAYEQFDTWIGFNSMALYCARKLDRDVYMIRDSFPNYHEDLKIFLKNRVSNFEVCSNSSDQFKAELLKELNEIV